MTLVNQIKKDVIQAMKAKDTKKLSTLRMLVAEFEKEKIAMKLTDVTELSNEQVQAVISRQIKKLNKEIEAYIEVGREVDSQEVEKELLTLYLPEQLADDELLAIVSEIARATKESGNSISFAMKELSVRLKGKADMKSVQAILKQLS